MNKISLLLLTIFVSCQSKPNQTEKQLPAINQDAAEQAIVNDTINGVIGFLVPSDSYRFDEVINVYTQEKELLKEIVRTDENQIVALMCIAQDDQYYQIKLENEQVGYIPKESNQVVFQTWKEHILNVFSVDFDVKANPLRKEPVEDSNTLYFDKNEFYHPIQIKEEWLQLKWGSEANWSYGWVKWKDEGRLIIELYYFA